MKIYATFGTDGAVRGFVHLDDDAPAPANMVLLTAEEFQDLYANQAMRRWNGKTIIKFTPPMSPAARQALDHLLATGE